MLSKRAPIVPDIEVAENQPATATLNAVLARFEDRILEILTTRLDPIVTALDAHTTGLNAVLSPRSIRTHQVVKLS